MINIIAKYWRVEYRPFTLHSTNKVEPSMALRSLMWPSPNVMTEESTSSTELRPFSIDNVVRVTWTIELVGIDLYCIKPSSPDDRRSFGTNRT